MMERSIKQIANDLVEEKDRRKKAIGERIRNLRKEKGLKLKQLSEMLTDHGQPISLSQLSRIEKGQAAIDDDLRIVLSTVLKVPERELHGITEEKPWFISRWNVAQEHLQAVVESSNGNDGSKSPHKYLIEKRVYQYVPLVAEMGGKGAEDKSVILLNSPNMQKFLVQIKATDEDEIKKGLENHSGEEIIHVLSGQLYFWYKQPSSPEVHKILLQPGDSVHFSSWVYHGFSARVEAGVAQALFIYSDVQVTTTPQLVKEKPEPYGGSL